MHFSLRIFDYFLETHLTCGELVEGIFSITSEDSVATTWKNLLGVSLDV